MLSISPEALTYIRERNNALHLELQPIIDCCIHLREAPTVRLGKPRDLQGYQLRVIDGVEVYVPEDLPDIPLTITLTSFLGYKRLVTEGWRLA